MVGGGGKRVIEEGFGGKTAEVLAGGGKLLDCVLGLAEEGERLQEEACCSWAGLD